MTAAMKRLSCFFVASLFSIWKGADGFSRSKGFLHATERISNEQIGTAEDAEEASEATLRLTTHSMVKQMLDGSGPSMADIAHAVHRTLLIDDAIRELDGKLPADVSALVRTTGKKRAEGDQISSDRLDENAVQKARQLLNKMMLDGWAELDDLLFEYKEFQARNRGEYEQVVSDLARLGSQVARLDGQEVSANQGISDADRERKEGEARMEQLSQDFMAQRFAKTRQLNSQRNDMAVFDFMLSVSRCMGKDEEATSVIQNATATVPSLTLAGANKGSNAVPSPQIQLCRINGGFEFSFDNLELQMKVEHMMTPAARLSLREALGQLPGRSLEGNGSTTAAASKGGSRPLSHHGMSAKLHSAEQVPHTDASQWRKCTSAVSHCRVLHDLLSAQWANIRDGLDGLAQEMADSQTAFDATMKSINDELTVVNDKKTTFMELLSGTISTINADTEEINEKDEQRRSLTHEFDRTSAAYHEKIADILFSRVCAVRRVRNEILKRSALSPSATVTDCDFADWTSKTGQCLNAMGEAIVCDDSCSGQDRYKCGGWETMKRDMVVPPSAYGMQCPAMERHRRCSQKRCPVNCVVSVWSGWSKCSKDCGGGVQVKTRSVLMKPRSGGLGCDAIQEARHCNTGSCDHDCQLADWSSWSPCSAACGGGMSSRSRPVLVPIRGRGRCPKPDAGERLQEQHCNAHDCVGDELCVAQQDLVVLLDASGSLGKDGFETLRSFAGALSAKYATRYLGQSAVRLAIGLFGNGRLISLPDGTSSISPAIAVQGLTDDAHLVQKRIAALKWQRGFTNLAQALALADELLMQGGRQSAQSSVLVLSDGKYSFKYQIAEKVQELKDKNVQILMAPVVEFDGSQQWQDLQRWVSFPPQTNFQQIPGVEVLKHNKKVFAQKLVTKFCPDTVSPTLERSNDDQKQYMLVRKGGWPSKNCATRQQQVTEGTKDACATAARSAKAQAFGFLVQMESQCLLLRMKGVSHEYWNAAARNFTDVACPGGEWEDNEMADTYIINPATI